MSEGELITAFINDIDTYPFKTRVNREVTMAVGVADITLPDYDVVIEAKSDGDVKRAIGQAVCYSESSGMSGYILIPVDEITPVVNSACERSNVGILTTTRDSLNFSVVKDVGGLESFHPKEYTNVQIPKPVPKSVSDSRLVGGAE